MLIKVYAGIFFYIHILMCILKNLKQHSLKFINVAKICTLNSKQLCAKMDHETYFTI